VSGLPGADFSPLELMMTIPEYRDFCVSMITLGLHDVVKGSAKDKASALSWLNDNDTEYDYSVRNMCQVLGLDVQKVRSIIKKPDELSGLLNEIKQIRRQKCLTAGTCEKNEIKQIRQQKRSK